MITKSISTIFNARNLRGRNRISCLALLALLILFAQENLAQSDIHVITDTDIKENRIYNPGEKFSNLPVFQLQTFLNFQAMVSCRVFRIT